MLNSGRAIVQQVNINQHILPLKVTQLEFPSLRAGKFKIRRFFPHLQREQTWRQEKQDRQKDCHGRRFSLHRSSFLTSFYCSGVITEKQFVQLLYHLIRPHEQFRWDSKTDLLCRLEVNDQLK